MALIPMAADAVKIPIVAAGGIADARGMVAALALGADGVYVGTRFMATRECDAHHKVKQAVVEARDACTVSVDKWKVVGRDLKNSFTNKYFDMKACGASMEELWQYISEHSMYRGLVQGDVDEGEVPCGQNAGIIDNIVSAAEVIQNLMSGTSSVFGQLKARVPTQ